MRTRQRSIAGLVVALLTAALVWWTQGGGSAPATDPGPGSSPPGATESSRQPGVDPRSGLPVVRAAALPPEAARILELIDAGGPFAEDEDGGTFQNREEILPDRPPGYYAEYTVPTPGSDDRGPRRIVAGDGGEYYWTMDHYQSFARIAR